MLLELALPWLCQWGFHRWRPDPALPRTQRCTRCGAVKTVLQPGERLTVYNVLAQVAPAPDQQEEGEA